MTNFNGISGSVLGFVSRLLHTTIHFLPLGRAGPIHQCQVNQIPVIIASNELAAPVWDLCSCWFVSSKWRLTWQRLRSLLTDREFSRHGLILLFIALLKWPVQIHMDFIKGGIIYWGITLPQDIGITYIAMWLNHTLPTKIVISRCNHN